MVSANALITIGDQTTAGAITNDSQQLEILEQSEGGVSPAHTSTMVRRMQFDNAQNLTAIEQFLKASQVTKIMSTAGHQRTQGLLERHNRNMLTLLLVFCSRLIQIETSTRTK